VNPKPSEGSGTRKVKTAHPQKSVCHPLSRTPKSEIPIAFMAGWAYFLAHPNGEGGDSNSSANRST
jgi:hypothetical protein